MFEFDREFESWYDHMSSSRCVRLVLMGILERLASHDLQIFELEQDPVPEGFQGPARSDSGHMNLSNMRTQLLLLFPMPNNLLSMARTTLTFLPHIIALPFDLSKDCFYHPWLSKFLTACTQ